MHLLELIFFVAGLAGLHQGASYGNATLSKWPRIALMTGSWSPRAWTRPVCCFLNWMRSGPYFVTSSSAWKCVSVTAAVFDHPAHGAAGALSQCASQLMYRTEQLSRN